MKHIMTWKTLYDYPELMKWVDFDKNVECGIDISKTYVSTTNNVWFKTPNGISFKRQAHSVVKAYEKYGKMPHETSVVISGWNDVLTVLPELKTTWNFKLNEEHGIHIEKLSPKSGIKVYTFCSNCGKEVEHARFLFSVTRNGVVFCDRCSRSIKTSFQEQTIYYYVKKMYPSAINGVRNVIGHNMEIDIYIPEKKFGIEYDGSKWHKRYTNRSKMKYKLCKDNGIFLLKATDLKRNIIDCDVRIVTNPQPTNDDYVNIIEEVARITGYNGDVPTVSIKDDTFKILETYKKVKYEKSFGFKNPLAVEFWDFEKNCGVNPYDISANDIHKFWFKSKEFGSYKKSPNQITSGKISIYHPQEATRRGLESIKHKVFLYDIKNKETTIDYIENICKKIGRSYKSVSRSCFRFNKGRIPISSDKKYIMFYHVPESEDILKRILHNHCAKDGSIKSVSEVWTYDKCIETYSLCTSKMYLKMNYSACYRISITNGWIDEFPRYCKKV